MSSSRYKTKKLNTLHLALLTAFSTYSTIAALPLWAAELSQNNVNQDSAQSSKPAKNKDPQEEYSAILSTVIVSGTPETSATKGYIGYSEADVTRNQLSIKEVPQTIDVLDIQKNKNYGTNDLSSILEGNAGIDATYDMRGENIFIRGFSADAGDIYRDGVRESGQVRRSTANVERVEILKGPASVLYGRSAGGGVINMVSKAARFDTQRQLGLSYGMWENHAASLDLNQKLNEHVAVRLTGELTETDSFRADIHSRGKMLSPSIAVRAGKLAWTGQYTFDSTWRVPDRGPSKDVYDLAGLPYKQGFARQKDFVQDDLQILRSDLQYAISNDWDLRWVLAHRTASQDFDHYYAGTYDPQKRLLNQNYAWQETDNKTSKSALTLNGRFNTGALTHKVSLGFDLEHEERSPTLATLRNQAISPFDDPENWPRLSTRPAATISNEHRATSNALFVQDLIGLTSNFKLMVGGRRDSYRFNSTDIKGQRSGYKGDSFSPNVGLVWDINAQHTAYVSWNKSFSPYGGNGYLGVAAASDAATFNKSPEHSRQYEIGLKSEWLNKELSTTLSLYDLEHANIRYRPDPDDLTRWELRGKERSRGIELSALGRLHPQWYIRGSLGLMSAKVLEDKASPEREGNHLQNTSDINGNLFLRYVARPWFAEAGVTHIGERYYYTAKNVEQNISGFTRWDAMVGYTASDWTFTGAIQNIFDKQYWRSNDMPGTPLAIMLKASYKF